MIQLDLLTIAFATGLAALVSLTVMIVLWRINRDTPGIPLWTLSVAMSTGAFFVSALRNALPDPAWLGPVISNTLSTTAVLVALEGCLRFRGYTSPIRWRLIFVIVPVLIGITGWLHDDLRTRLLVIDAVSFSGFVAIAVVMIWRTEDNRERLVNGLSSLFVMLPALAILVRWIETLNQPSTSALTDLSTGNLIFLSAMIYVMGWTFSLTVACYFKAQRTISQLAREDALTGLPNRRHIDEVFLRTLKEAQRYDRPFAVIVVDMDDFKLINDNFGHIAGDELLREVANRLRIFKRESDFVGRLGGDEFLLILGNVDTMELAGRTVQRLIDVIRGPVELEGTMITITPSIGIAVWPADGDSYDELLGCADKRMYVVKSGHKSEQKSESDIASGDASGAALN